MGVNAKEDVKKWFKVTGSTTTRQLLKSKQYFCPVTNTCSSVCAKLVAWTLTIMMFHAVQPGFFFFFFLYVKMCGEEGGLEVDPLACFLAQGRVCRDADDVLVTPCKHGGDVVMLCLGVQCTVGKSGSDSRSSSLSRSPLK